jgi:hypothetical protein
VTGPIDERVGKLLGELPSLTEDDALFMADLWAEEDAAARGRAWQQAKAAIERAGKSDLLDRARSDVGNWMKAAPADFHGISGLLGREGGHVGARRAAAPALLDAVAGFIAERDLHSADFDVLTRPWRIAMEDEPDRRTAGPTVD